MTTPLSSTARADALISPDHPFAAPLRMVAEEQRLRPHRSWEPADGPLPALFISHGAPMLFEIPDWMNGLFAWARNLPRPRAILIVSAHWEAAPLSISAVRPSELVYDFGGFHPMHHQMRYDTPGAEALARRVLATLPDAEEVHQETVRGLDHGAWVPLKIMYPEADVPVLQLSLPTYDPDRLMALGRHLKSLREEGILVIGSGYMTHGLPYIDWQDLHSVPGWSSDFDLWAADALSRGDVEELSRFRSSAPGMPYAHPTVEHFTPLFVTLGAAADPTAPVTTTIDGYTLGLARRSFQAA